MAKKEKKPNTGIVPTKETLAFLIGGVGSGMIYSIMSSLITDFYLNVMKLAPMFVFWLMLLARIWDAVSDPMMGMIMDRANPKRGKMRSWIFYMSFPIAIITFLMFFSPNLPMSQKMIYAAVTYTLWGTIFCSMDIPYWSLPNAMTPNAHERGKLITLGRTTNGIGAAVPMLLLMVLTPIVQRMMPAGTAQVDVDSRKYFIIALICAFGGGLLIFLTPFKVKERVPLPKADSNKGALKKVLTCKPLMLTALAGILSGGRYMLQAGQAHVMRFAYYIGPDLGGLTATQRDNAIADSMTKVALGLQVACAVGMLGAMLAVPMLMKKLNYKQMLIGSCLLGGTAGIVMFLVGPDHFWFSVFMLFLVSIPLGVINTATFAMVGDALDYMEWSKGYRNNGLGLAAQSFVVKLANAIASSVIVLVYPMVGIDQQRNANLFSVPVAQQATVKRGFFSIISIVPAISLLVSIIPILFYDLTGKKKETIERELAERRALTEAAASEA